jgi:hypothetical protein
MVGLGVFMVQMTIEQVLDVVYTLPRDERLSVAQIIQQRECREAFAQECDDAVAEYHRGNVGTRGLEAILKDLDE